MEKKLMLTGNLASSKVVRVADHIDLTTLECLPIAKNGRVLFDQLWRFCTQLRCCRHSTNQSCGAHSFSNIAFFFDYALRICLRGEESWSPGLSTSEQWRLVQIVRGGEQALVGVVQQCQHHQAPSSPSPNCCPCALSTAYRLHKPPCTRMSANQARAPAQGPVLGSCPTTINGASSARCPASPACP